MNNATHTNPVNDMHAFRPDTPEQLQHWMADMSVTPGWCVNRLAAAQMQTPQWIDLSGLKAVEWYSPDDLTVTVQAGITIGELQAVLAENQQYWPFFAPDDTVLADFLATDGPGLEAGLLGFPRDWVLGTQAVTGTGVLSESGGRVVKNVTGYDLNKLIIGSQHTLAVLTGVTLKVKKLPEQQWLAQAEFDDLTDAFRFVDFLLRQSDQLAVCELVQASRLDPRRRRTDGWMVIIGFRGEDRLLQGLKPLISEFSPDLNWLGQAEQSELLTRLSHWSTDFLVLEWAFPPAASLLVCREVFNVFALLDRPMLQIRPAAGLLYTTWNKADVPDGYRALAQTALKNLSELGVTIQCVQSPVVEEYAFWNMPALPEVQTLNYTLKRLYDPNQRLGNPILPL